MAEDTIPKNIRHHFLERAQQVCDLAKVDYWEYSEVLSDLREQMESSYRAYEAAGDYKDDAEAKALEDFGSVEEVAKVHRDGFRGLCHRLLYNSRYSVHRMVFPTMYCMFHAWLRTSGSLQTYIFRPPGTKLGFVLFGWHFYTGMIFIAVLVLFRWLTKVFKQSKDSMQFVVACMTLGLFYLLFKEWADSVTMLMTEDWNGSSLMDNTPHWKNTLVGVGYAIGYVVEALAFLIVLVLALAEIFELSERRRSAREEKKKAYG